MWPALLRGSRRAQLARAVAASASAYTSLGCETLTNPRLAGPSRPGLLQGLQGGRPPAGPAPPQISASARRGLSARAPAALFDAKVLNSIVKVYTVHSAPNFYMPWQMKPQRESTGSGFVIRPRAILTNAHVVADGSFVMVKRHGGSARYPARVAHVGHECDLALLEVDSPEFWEEADPMEPLALGSIPELQDSVVVAGYPQGGHNLSVSGGVVSRVDLAQYVHGAARLMAIQIDAAINPGNSGGPALRGREVVGVAFQNLRDSEGIGYIIPTPVVRHFLADIETHGQYVGFCSLGVRCQPTENPMLRASLGMPQGRDGVLISSVRPLGAAAAAGLRSGDVLLEIDGVAVASDGTVPMRGRERISFDHLVGIKQAGESAQLSVLRQGEQLSCKVDLEPLEPLVPVQMYDQQPSYLVFAGLVFVPLTQPYLHEHGEDWYNTCPRALCEKAMAGHPEWPGHQVVVLSQVLVDAINQGYQSLADLQVHAVNGTPVASLRHLKHLISSSLAACDGPDGLAGAPYSQYLRFDLDEDRVLVVDPEQIPMSSQRILAQHRIPAAESPDLTPPPSPEELSLWADAVKLRLSGANNDLPAAG